MLRNKKAYSIVEIIMATTLSMMLGLLVATTLDSATKSLRTTNTKVEANHKAREISSYLQKYISSADRRSYCEPDANTCLTFRKYTNDPVYSYYYRDASGFEQLQFFSAICSSYSLTTLINNSSNKKCDNSNLKNPAEIAITFTPPTTTDSGKIRICRLESGNQLLILTNILTNSIPTSQITCNANSSNTVYQQIGIKAVNNQSVFRFVDNSGVESIPTTSPTLNELSKINSVKIIMDVPWDLKYAYKSTRNNIQGSRIELYISQLGA